MGSLSNKLPLMNTNTNNKHADGAGFAPTIMVMSLHFGRIVSSLDGSENILSSTLPPTMLSTASEPSDDIKKKLSHMADFLVYNCQDSPLESTIAHSFRMSIQRSTWGAPIDYGFFDSQRSGGVSSSAQCNATISPWRIWTWSYLRSLITTFSYESKNLLWWSRILSPFDLILHAQRSHLCINSLVVSTFHFMTNHQMVDYRSYSKEARIHEVAFVATGLIGLRWLSVLSWHKMPPARGEVAQNFVAGCLFVFFLGLVSSLGSVW